jgi:hypothetical protein
MSRMAGDSLESLVHRRNCMKNSDAQTILNAASARMLRVSFGVM